MTDLIDFLLDGQFVETRQWQAQEKTDPAVENHESLAEGLLDLLGCAGYCGRVRYTPVRGHRLPRPDRADFFGSVVTDGKHEVQVRGVGLREFVPILATCVTGWQFRDFELAKRSGVNNPLRVAACAVSRKVRKAFTVEYRFGHDGPSGVSRA